MVHVCNNNNADIYSEQRALLLQNQNDIIAMNVWEPPIWNERYNQFLSKKPQPVLRL